MILTLTKDIITDIFTLRIGDIITTYEKCHYFNIDRLDSNNKPISLPYIFGVNVVDGRELVKSEDIPKARIDCDKFIEENFKN